MKALRLVLLGSVVVVAVGSGACQTSVVGPGGDPDAASADAAVDTDAATSDAGTGEVCSIVPSNSGCAIGEACDVGPAADDELACRSFVPDARSATACASDEECDSGWSCERLDTDPLRRCMQFCEDDADCSSGACVAGQLSDNAPAGLGLCTDDCVPVGAEGCPSGASCGLGSTEEIAVLTLCVTAGPLRVGDECTGEGDGACRPGLMCTRRDGIPRCHRFCNMDDPVCGGSYVCKSLVPNVILHGVEYGVCGPPS